MKITYHTTPDFPILSVGILTIPERKEEFNKTLWDIYNAVEQYEDKVEVISIYSSKGTPKIGAKRQEFLSKARGEYCVMIDDDDSIAPFYFHSIIPVLINDKPDCIGHLIDCEFYVDGKISEYKTAIVSNQFTGLSQSNYHPQHDYAQGIYYKVPVKTELARKAGFENIAFGEDDKFSLALKKHLKTEVFINEALYIYIHNRITGETRAQRYGDPTL